MIHIQKLKRLLYVWVTGLNWWLLLLIAAGHSTSLYWLLVLAGEEKLTQVVVTYFYYWNTTASTVGYGDLSPSTPWGQFIVSTWGIYGGIGVFGLVITRAGASLTGFWRRKMTGQADFSDQQDHTIIVGWHGERTKHLLEVFFGDETEGHEIVICSTTLEQHPLPEQPNIHFVKGESLHQEEMLMRAGIKSAHRIIILGESDESTLAACMAVYSLTKDEERETHIVAYFSVANIAKYVDNNCPSIETLWSTSTEQLVRSSQDPGSSRVMQTMVSTLVGPTQFSLPVPQGIRVSYGDVFTLLKEQYDATLLGLAKSVMGADLIMNAPTDQVVEESDILYYMSSSRIGGINWRALEKEDLL